MKPIICLLLAWLGLYTFAHGQDLEKLKDADPFTMNGSIRLSAQYYGVNGIAPRANPFMWNASGRAEIRIYDQLRLPFAFTIGRHRPELRYPVFNQFGVSPSYKWITVHAGHRNMQFSRYTLNNHTFLGAGLELKPGKFRFSAMAGQLQRGIREFDEAIDLFFGAPVYNRFGYGFKVGVGSEKSYVDLIYFHGRDGKLGLENPPADTLLPRRAENTVLGLNWRQQIADPLSFEFEAAVSGFNRDMDSEVLDLGSPAANKWIGYLFQPRFASEAGLALRGSLQYRKNAFNLGVNYERIDPGFETMGAYFFNSDWENYTANAGFSAFANKVRLMGSFGLQRNNVYELRAETSQRIIGALNASIQPQPAWGMDLNYSNYSQDHRPGTIQVLDDTLRIASTTHNMGGGLRYSLIGEGTVTTFLLNSNYQLTDNQNPLNDGFQEVNAFFTSLACSQAFQNQTTQLQGSINYNSIDVGTLRTTGYGLNVGGRQLLFERRMSLSLNNTFNLNQVNGNQDGWTNALNFNGQYKINDWNALGYSISWLKRTSTATNPFSEFRGQINYSLTIPPVGGSKKQ